VKQHLLEAVKKEVVQHIVPLLKQEQKVKVVAIR
jgi:hypothetical protein